MTIYRLLVANAIIGIRNNVIMSFFIFVFLSC